MTWSDSCIRRTARTLLACSCGTLIVHLCYENLWFVLIMLLGCFLGMIVFVARLVCLWARGSITLTLCIERPYLASWLVLGNQATVLCQLCLTVTWHIIDRWPHRWIIIHLWGNSGLLHCTRNTCHGNMLLDFVSVNKEISLPLSVTVTLWLMLNLFGCHRHITHAVWFAGVYEIMQSDSRHFRRLVTLVAV